MRSELGILSGGGSIPHPSATSAVTGGNQKGQDIAASEILFEVLETDAQLDQLQDAWCDLFQRSKTESISQSFAWAKNSWLLTAKNHGWSLAIVVGRISGRAVFIWPLVWRQYYAWKIARVLGPNASEYAEILLDPDFNKSDLVSGAWDFVKQQLSVDYFSLKWVLRGSSLSRVTRFAGAKRLESDVVPFLRLSDWNDWDALYTTAKSKRRREDRRRARILASMGKLTFQDIEKEDDLNEVLDWVFDHKKAWLERSSVISPWLQSHHYEAFLRALCHASFVEGVLLMRTLRLDGQIIAAKVAFILGDNIECLIATYDRDFLQYGPGRLLINDTFRLAYEQGIKTFDYRLGEESYKYEYADREVIADYYLVPCSFWGQCYTTWRAGALRRFFVEKIVKRLPHRLTKSLIMALKRQ